MEQMTNCQRGMSRYICIVKCVFLCVCFFFFLELFFSVFLDIIPYTHEGILCIYQNSYFITSLLRQIRCQTLESFGEHGRGSSEKLLSDIYIFINLGPAVQSIVS